MPISYVKPKLDTILKKICDAREPATRFSSLLQYYCIKGLLADLESNSEDLIKIFNNDIEKVKFQLEELLKDL